MVEVFAPLGEAYRSEALAVEGCGVAATQVAVGTEDEDGREGGARCSREVGARGVGDRAGQFAAGRIVFLAESAHAAGLLRCGGGGDPFGEDPHAVFELQRVAWSGVAAHDIVVEYSLELPAFAVGEFGQMTGAVEAL